MRAPETVRNSPSSEMHPMTPQLLIAAARSFALLKRAGSAGHLGAGHSFLTWWPPGFAVGSCHSFPDLFWQERNQLMLMHCIYEQDACHSMGHRHLMTLHVLQYYITWCTHEADTCIYYEHTKMICALEYRPSTPHFASLSWNMSCSLSNEASVSIDTCISFRKAFSLETFISRSCSFSSSHVKSHLTNTNDLINNHQVCITC